MSDSDATYPSPWRPPDTDELVDILRSTRRVAVLGASDRPTRAARYVPAYLASVGYEVVGVNPTLAGTTLFGHEVRSTLAEAYELDGPFDLIDVFRRSEHLAAHLPELLALRPRPAVVWFQLGVRDDDVAAALEAVGIRVVQDRCTLADHRRLGDRI